MKKKFKLKYLITSALILTGVVNSNLTQASNKQVLNVYTYNSFNKYGPAKQIKEEFEKVCNCVVNYNYVKSQSNLISQLKLKMAVQADVFVGIDLQDANINEIQDNFLPYDIKLPELAVPWIETSKVFVPFDWSPITLLTTNKEIPEDISFEAFLNDKSTIIYTDPRIHTLGKYLIQELNYVYPNKNDLSRNFDKLRNKTVTIGKSWSETWGAFLKGESDTYWGYSSSVIYNRLNGTTEEEKNSVRPLNIKEGVLASIEVAAIYNGAKNIELANEFLQFLLTPSIQTIMVEKNSSYPIIKLDLPVLQGLPKYKILPDQFNRNKLIFQLDSWLKSNN